MKNLLVYYDPEFTTKLEDIAVPEHGPDKVLIKVVVAGSNPKDWKHPHPDFFDVKVNQGDDVAGIVVAVGSKVKNFGPGDRVAGMHHTVFHIPDSLSCEEAATIPLAMFTAAVGLYRNLRLPLPCLRSDQDIHVRKIPLVINGGSTSVGAFAIKLAKLNSSIGPIIATAGSGAAFVETLGGVDAIVDYRSSNIIDDLRKALGGKKLFHVFDASNSIQSVAYLSSVLEPTGRYTCTTSVRGGFYGTGEQQQTLERWGGWWEQIWVGSIHEDKLPGGKWLGGVMSRLMETFLDEGKFAGHPYEIVPGGLNGVEAALIKLRDRKNGNEKFVTRLADTEGFEL